MRGRNLAAIVAALALLATACTSAASPTPGTSQGPGPTGGPTAAPVVNLVLRYCWHGDAEISAMESIIQDFNTSQSAIKVRGISGRIKPDEIIAAVTAGAPPDMIIECNSDDVAPFAANNVIVALDDPLKAIKADTSNIIPASLEWVTYKDKLYGLPFLQDTWGLYWNTDAFTAAGLDPAKPPTTIAELDADAAKLTKYSADGKSLERIGFVPDDPGKDIKELSRLFGCTLFDGKKLLANTPPCVAMFDWYKSYYDKYNKKGELTALIAGEGGLDSDLFESGKAAMCICGEWLPGAGYIPDEAPDLHYDTAGFPGITAALAGSAYLNGNSFSIPRGSTDVNAALTFGMYLMTDGPSRKMAIQNSSVPQLKTLLTDPQLNAIPHFGTFIDIANRPTAWSDPLTRVWQKYLDGLYTALDDIKAGTKTSQAALDAVVTSLQPDIDTNGP
jgi:multiple sugar transport system substrate-binding protein